MQVVWICRHESKKCLKYEAFNRHSQTLRKMRAAITDWLCKLGLIKLTKSNGRTRLYDKGNLDKGYLEGRLL